MRLSTVGEHLYWSYANLCMAHAAVGKGEQNYRQGHYIIRSRMFGGFRKGVLNVASLADDERLKLIIPQACCYCGSRDNLSVDHLISRKKGGIDAGDNMVWSCRSCNSSKGAKDMMEWYRQRGQFPPLLLLRRYLKLCIEYCEGNELMNASPDTSEILPFSLLHLPKDFPPPSELTLWVSVNLQASDSNAHRD